MPVLRFEHRSDPRWPAPNPVGLPGVFEGHCPPYHDGMRGAVESYVRRQFGPGGPYHPATPGPFRDPAAVRGAAEPYSDDFKDCVATMADYVLERFGKFPATVPSVHALVYLQAHHVDLEFYDRHFDPAPYLRTHAEHMSRWHPDPSRADVEKFQPI